MRQGASITLRGGPEAVPTARKAVEDGWAEMAGERLDDLRLLVSELVTNSVRHGGVGAEGKIELRVATPDDRVRVEVCDPGSDWVAPDEMRPSDPREPGGWGLFLVDQMADRWGVSKNAATCVWFELDCGAEPVPG
jgi:anti-sigma regulatory factor (Ser/Thr protein kinase)